MVMVDYIIVGQGLAGSAVAIELLKCKKRIVVIDQPLKNNCSRVAAGLVNPITGKNMVKTWLADQIFPCLEQFYGYVEEKTQRKLFHWLPLYRPFFSIEEQNEWMGKSADPIYADYIDSIYTHPQNNGLKDPFGGLILKRSGYLDTIEFLEAAKILIERHATLLLDDFHEHELLINDNGVRFRDFEANRIIFCQGVHKNKWFSWLPLRPLKGETVKIRTTYFEKRVINRGLYIVPAEYSGVWRVGSTYNFMDHLPGVTDKARVALESKLNELISFPYEIIDHAWGMRPTTIDRRPILGAHPQYPQLIIFNGLGTKGVSLAPYFSNILVRWLENKGMMNKEVDIKRYKSVYSGSPK